MLGAIAGLLGRGAAANLFSGAALSSQMGRLGLGNLGGRLGMGGLGRGPSNNPLTQDGGAQSFAPAAAPGQAQFVSAGESRVGRDAEGETAQRDALRRMRQISDTGYSDIDRAAMSQAQNARKAADRTSQESIMRNAQRRGASASSGGDLSAALIAGQGSASRLAEDTRQINAQGQQRRTEATGAMSQMGGDLTGQQMQIGQAQNQMALGNAQMQNQINAGNAGHTTQANISNNATQQGALNQNSQQGFQANAANTAYNQQMFGQFMRPVMGRFGSMMGGR